MLYLPITREWIVSPIARRIYFGCALANLALHAVLMGTRLAVEASGAGSVAASPLAVMIVKSLLWPGIVGTGLLSVAMWYFWFSFDRFRWMRRASWFLVLFWGITIGPALYYFFVYRNNEAFRP
jgi:lysylphosphatidylglycerol synthetase-like protein (DUF2156 family)